MLDLKIIDHKRDACGSAVSNDRIIFTNKAENSTAIGVKLNKK